ncbi:PepSY domain-containing protein [uncultured Duncaniella sp.]|uniref:PepSY-associated TM helix domain-containing protein n=1 Tax=uncultured Duncaniella sp. TaxID=2768039 RepID=UPI0026581B51|nr:PepSY-associated TM helix domain-containing protein [uncultured Duncaniella sp.]
MIKIFRKIHLWLSVPFGIIITLICFSGAMLIFEPEITRGIKKNVYYVQSVKDNPKPIGELMETVKSSLPDSVSITGVTVFKDETRTYQVNLSKPRRSSIFIDQYTGVITGRYERIGFFSTMFKLHRWLLDNTNPHGSGIKIGKTLVGISTLMFVIALISGIVIWWPRARKNLLRSLSISFSKGWKGFWKGLHVAGGMYALIFVLAMALTGLTWSFDWYRTAFYAVCGVEHTPRNFGQSVQPDRSSRERHGKEGEHRRRGGHRHSEFGRWQQVYDELDTQYPDVPQITVGPETASVTLGTAGNTRASDRYAFNRRSGELSPVTKYTDSKEADKLRGWIYSIHTGSIGGFMTRILWFIAALLGASLPLTGYYIWIKHLMRKKDQAV